MVVYRQDRRRRLTLVLLVITSLVLISLDERGSGLLDSARSAAQDVVSPIQGVVDDLVDPAADFFDSFGRADELEAANAKLREQNAELRVEVDRGATAVAENDQLRDLADLPQVEDFDAVTASVVSGSVDNFSRTWRLDKGSANGIEVDMPVVVGGSALVGRIASVATNSAVVQRIDDGDFGAGAQLVNADGPGPDGSASGVRGSRLLEFQLFNSGTAIEKGAKVQTSGVATSSFPKGLPIGTIQRSVPATSAVSRAAKIVPLVNLDSVDIVKVLRYQPPAP